MHGFEVNWTSVGMAAVAKFAIGAVWYSPVAFGAMWRAAAGVDQEAMKARFVRGMIVDLVGCLITAWVLANCLQFMGAMRLVSGARTAFFLWLGFVAPPMLSSGVYEGRPMRLFWITGAYWLVSMLAMGAIIGGG
jgi:hypothetical protein